MKVVKNKIILPVLIMFAIVISTLLLITPAFRVSAAIGEVEINGIIEIPENDLPDDLETLQQGEAAGGKFIFFSADNLGPGETAASINDGAIYLEKFEITFSFNSEEVSYVLESGKHYMYKLPESFTVTTIKSISDSTTMPVPNCPSIQISDTFNGNIVHEISETDLPDDLRYLEKGEDLSGKYIFFSGEWIKAATYMMNISPKGMLTFAYAGASSQIGIMTYYDDISSKSSVLKINLDSTIYYYMQLPDLGTVAESNTNLNAFKVSDTFTPADLEEPGTDVEEPGTETWEPELIEISEDQLPSDIRTLNAGEDISGKALFIFSDDFSEYVDTSISFMTGSIEYMVMNNYFGVNGPGISYYVNSLKSGTWYYYIVSPDSPAVVDDLFDSDLISISDTFPETDPGVEDPGSDIEKPDTDAEEPGTVGDWFNDLGNTISDWLGENVGLTVSGSAVLVIGGIILFFIIFRKRR